MDKVHPNCVTTVLWESGRIRLHPTQEWNTDDPFVKARPEFFDIKTPYEAKSPGYEPPVERGTRAPGEKRMTRRRTVEKAEADGE